MLSIYSAGNIWAVKLFKLFSLEEKLNSEIIQWDTVNWSRPLNYWEKIISSENKTLKCLELGGREGGLSLWLALKGHSVICSDLENSAAQAQSLHKKYGVDSKIVYEDMDASQIPYENYFDLIIFKSILGGIGRDDNKAIQEKVINQIYKALKPGGRLFFAENTRATLLHRFFRKYFTNWGSSWRYISPGEMKEFLSAFSSSEIMTTGFLGVFGRNENQKRILGKTDSGFFNFIIPSSWKYIVYGVAVK